MKITNPIFGAGNGKVGPLVGWKQGDAQIFRKNSTPKAIASNYAVLSQARVRQAGSLWNTLTEEEKTVWKGYALANGFASGWLLFCSGFTRAVISQYATNEDWSERTKSDVVDNTVLAQFGALIGTPANVDWQLKSSFSDNIQPNITTITAAINSISNSIEFGFNVAMIPDSSPFNNLHSLNSTMGFMLEVTLISGKKKIKRLIAVTSKFNFHVPTPSTSVTWKDNPSQYLHLFDPLIPAVGMKFKAKLYLVASDLYFQTKLICSCSGTVMTS
jgi:hypothetical protein